MRTLTLDWEPSAEFTSKGQLQKREQSWDKKQHREQHWLGMMCKVQDGSLLLIFQLILLLAITLGISSCAKNSNPPELKNAIPIKLIDAVGDTIQLSRPANRVITLAPNLTEMMYAIGAGEKLVGRTAFCDYPQQALQLPIMGDMLNIDYEKILQAKPDIVLMTIAGNSRSGYDKLKELGLRPIAIDAATITGVIRSLDTIGLLVGNQHQSGKLVSELEHTLDSITQIATASPAISAFLVIDRSMLITVSRGFIHEALTIAGGENIAAGSIAAYPVIGREELLRKNPEVIILPAASQADAESLLELYPEWRVIRAVRNERLHIIQPGLIERPGPRIVEGIVQLYRLLHNHQ